jgi:rare lipoprotein A (peptidoglycan hydrolase)
MDRPGKDTRFFKLGARCAALAALCALAALGVAGPAAAQTGGASTAVAIEAETGGGIAFSAFRSAAATWYGPGFYGRRTACGQVLRPGTLGVAHRDLPCGTAVKFVYDGRQIVTRVIDRGPYSKGYSWDLTNGAREALGFEGSGRIRYAVARQFARR